MFMRGYWGMGNKARKPSLETDVRGDATPGTRNLSPIVSKPEVFDH